MTAYEFYRNTFAGTAGEAEFQAAVGTAEAVIRALLRPAMPEDFSDAQLEVFHRAVCIQADYGRATAAEGTMRIKKESLGDRSVTYDTENGAGDLRVMGISVSPQAVLLLENSGHLSRWV